MKEIIIYVLSAIVLAILGWLFERVKTWINVKIKNEKAKKIMAEITCLIEDAVKATYQEYVEALKKEGTFDKDSQLNALSIAKQKIQASLSDEAKEFLSKNYINIDGWIETTIHSVLYNLKNKGD